MADAASLLAAPDGPIYPGTDPLDPSKYRSTNDWGSTDPGDYRNPPRAVDEVKPVANRRHYPVGY